MAELFYQMSKIQLCRDIYALIMNYDDDEVRINILHVNHLNSYFPHNPRLKLNLAMMMSENTFHMNHVNSYAFLCAIRLGFI